MRRPTARAIVTAVAGLSVMLTACSPTAESARTGDGDGADGVVEVVASTSVYGDIVSTIGGDKVRVNSIIARTSQDPHSYEATTQDKLAVSKAEMLVENGGGYDDFIHKLADDAGLDHANVLSAVELSGLAPEEDAGAHTETSDASGHGHDHEGFNEHVWYSLPAMSRLADAVAAKLGELEPDSAGTFKSNAASFKESLAGLEAKLATTAAIASSGQAGPAAVAVTEPVPSYLLAAAGLEDQTPAEYKAAIESGSDVPPAVLKAAVDLVSSGGVRLLAYNSQTEGPQTLALKEAAAAAGVPVLNFSETLPDGKNYLQWMSDNVDGITRTLS
ncbi:zinc/manganese transport system substrate-binding protein [Arthrobacter sp. V4I6]|uniref:metal ABC transporter solute-binding protein, Zn/Mn family n=1 Tax=unclassified Arthrobacter TaxID=235627 RepID=UPI00277F4BF8|nr:MULTISPECIES: zinc ABC transporter substrate-binding protein [unclassified Arthrobacter]MDQ0820268.1 zinc/manganese transport system substrate-binding protein [Arthrobacter sp. V1I7]MDQ0854450.1 zinc/manganese transport system substrate-binding protein [Arthrobacter sp. V4I6]